MSLIQSLEDYKKTNQKISEVCLTVFARHYWYLSDILVGLAFFDDRIDDETKVEMVAALKNRKNHDKDEFRNNSLIIGSKTDIVDLISEKTLKLFQILSGTEFVGFLETPPSEWCNNVVFQKMHSIVCNLAVVNDSAERAIGLIKQLNNTLTADQQKQNHLIQVVEQFRKENADKNKSTFMHN